MLTSFEIVESVVKTLDGKKARDIKALKTKDVTVLAEYFVICTANSTTQVKALSDEIEKKLEELGETVLHREGYRSGSWVVLDYSCVVVHVFMEEARKFYALERLWADAPEVDISGWISEE